MKKFPRARFGAAILVAFVSGLVFASGMDLTRFGWAQARVTPASQVPAGEVASLMETQNAFEAIVDRVKPAVVSIEVRSYGGNTRPQRRDPRLEGIPPQFRDFFDAPGGSDAPREGSGSGFIVSADGYILTNNHVVADADEVRVRLVDRREFSARVIGKDPTTDVALIKIDATNLPVAVLGNDATARVGQWVLAIGNPLALEFTVTAGIVSAKGRGVNAPNRDTYAIADFIQTDAAINPGNSGGPLVNIRGEVIGINSMIASRTGTYAGYGFAIPVTLAKQVMDDFIRHGRVRRALIGVGIQELDPESAEAAGLRDIRGALVTSFTPSQAESPAAKAGIRLGDVIVRVGGQAVDQVPSLQRIVRGYAPGQTVEVELMRRGESRKVQVRLAEAPSEGPTVAERNPGRTPESPAAEPAARARSFDRIGVTAEPVSQTAVQRLGLPREAREGLLITDVDVRSASYQRLAPQWVILKVLSPVERDLRTTADLEQALGGVRAGSVMQLLVWAGGTTTVVSVRAR